MSVLEIIASIEWPDGEEVTHVWAHDSRIVYWTGPDFTPLIAAMEEKHLPDETAALAAWELALFERYDDHMANTDRDLLAEINE